MQEIDEFVQSSSRTIYKLCNDAKEFQIKELDALAANSSRIDEQLQIVQDALTVIQAKDASESETLGVVHKVITETHDTFKTGFGAWGEMLKKTCDVMVKDMDLVGIEAFTVMEGALKTMVSLVENVVREVTNHVDAERETTQQLKVLASEASKSEVTRLKRQNEELVKMLETEKIKGSKAKDELIQRVSSLLGDFTAERDRSLRDAVGGIQAGNSKGEEGIKSFGKKHGEIMEQMENDGMEVTEILQERSSEGKRTRDGAFKVNLFLLIASLSLSNFYSRY